MAKVKLFKVAAVSSNTNSFGLHGMILMGADGEAWQVGANSINVKAKGDVLRISLVPPKSHRAWEQLGFEIPKLLPRASLPVIREVWGR